MASSDQVTTTTERSPQSFSARFMHGATFLTFEHFFYFLLAVLVPTLLVVGSLYAIGLWSGRFDLPQTLMWPPEANARRVQTGAVGVIVAALIVLVAKMFVLRRRLAAEYVKRSGYKNRVAYKLPVYGALWVLVSLSMVSFISMLGVFLNSLLMIGVSGVSVGEMYRDEFMPALLAFVVFSAAAWYVLGFAKGKDTSKLFVNVMVLLGLIVSIALVVTALNLNHGANTQPTNPIQIEPYPMPQGRDDYIPY